MVDDKRDDGGAKPPQSRGGGRSKHPVALAETSLRSKHPNLKPWAKGVSGNPLGLPKSVIEIAKLAREHSAAAVERLRSIMMNDKASYRDQIAAAVALLDRGCGRPPFGIYHSTGGANFDNQANMNAIDGNAQSALLIDATRRKDAAYAAELRAELARIDAAEARQRAEREDEIEEARRAKMNGEEIHPGMEIFLATHDSES